MEWPNDAVCLRVLINENVISHKINLLVLLLFSLSIYGLDIKLLTKRIFIQFATRTQLLGRFIYACGIINIFFATLSTPHLPSTFINRITWFVQSYTALTLIKINYYYYFLRKQVVSSVNLT